MTRSILAAATVALLVGCGASAPPPSTPPSTTQPTAYGGGPTNNGRLTPSPYDAVGGMNDDEMNSEPTTEGVAPSFQQPDAKANATKKNAHLTPNGEPR